MTPKLLASREKVPDAIGEIVSKLGLSMTEAQLGVFYNIVNNDEFINTLSPSEVDLLKHLEKLEKYVSNKSLEERTSSKGPILRKLRMIKDKLEKMEKTNLRLKSIFQKKV